MKLKATYCFYLEFSVLVTLLSSSIQVYQPESFNQIISFLQPVTLSQGFSGHFLHYVTGIRTRLKWCSNLIFDKRGYSMLLNIFCGYQVLLLIFSAAPQCHLCSYRYCARPSLLTLLPRLRGPESLLLKRCRFMRKQRRGPVCFDERDL